MSRRMLFIPWLFVASVAAQVPVAPSPATPPAPPAPPKSPTLNLARPAVPTMPDLSYELDRAFNFEMPDMSFAIDDAFAKAETNLAFDRVSAAVDRLAARGVFANLDELGAGGPIAWAQQDPADSLYREARDQLNRGDYRKAAQLFKSLPSKYPNSVYVADAQYWQAFSLYRIGDTPELQEALAVLEARKPAAEENVPAGRGRVGNGVGAGVGVGHAGARTRAGTDEVPAVVSINTSFNRGGRFGVDAAGLAARIANVLSSRGMANDPAVKRALAAAGNTCDQEDQSVRAEALSALMQNDPETGRQLAAKILANRDECSVPLRRNAVMVVGAKRDDAAAATLIPVAKSDPAPIVRMAAIEYLVRIQTDAAVNAVIDLAKTDTSTMVQRAAIGSLSSSSNARARAEIHSIVENSTNEVLRTSALDALDRNITPDDAVWLRGLYAKTTNPRIKERIVAALGRAGGDANNQWLVALVRNDDESLEVRTAALSRTGRSLDIATLVKMYDASSQRPIREEVISLLSDRKEPEALDKLVDIAKNGTDIQLRTRAISALSRSKDPRAAKLLTGLIDR